MKKLSLVKNIIYSFLLQISNLILSLITSPFISEVLGAEQIGRVDFISAFAHWFTLLSMFGITSYGVRAVAKTRGDKDELSKVFSELSVIRLVFTSIALLSFGAVIASVDRIRIEYQLALLQCLVLLLSIFSIDWFFQGMEDYRYIALRSAIFKAISVAAVFMFIKTQDDIMIYATIVAVSHTLANLFNIFYVRKRVKLTLKGLQFRRHFRPLSYFFVSTMLINIYTMIDQSLLGFWKTDKDVALFARSRMFLGVACTITGSINAALMPRLIKYYDIDPDSYKRLLSFFTGIMLFFAVPLSICLIFISKYLLALIGSTEFLEAETVLWILGLTIVFSNLGAFNYSQRIVPRQKEKFGIYVYIVTAVINLVCNLLLIKPLGIVGCAISCLISEIACNTIWFVYAYRQDGYRMLLRWVNLKYLFAAAVMAGALLLLDTVLTQITWLNFVLTIIVGAIVYALAAIAVKEESAWYGIKVALKLLSKKPPQPPAESSSVE